MGVYWTAVLLCHLLASLVHSLTCNERKQYKWPASSPTRCCQKCEPGEFMEKRCQDGSIETKCQECSPDMYTDVPNFLAQCKMCKPCSKNQVQKAACSRLQNTVCDCKQGYKCTDAECSECEKEDHDHGQDQVTTTQQPTTTERRKTTVNKERHETVLLPLVLIVCVCILLLILVHMRKRLDPLGWCTFDDLSSSKDTPQSTELEEAVPIQEVCSDLQEVKDGLEGEFCLEHNHIY